MMHPRVFKGRVAPYWFVKYAPYHVAEPFPTWREAFDHAFTVARVSHVAANVIREIA